MRARSILISLHSMHVDEPLVTLPCTGPEGQKQRSPRTQAAVDQWMKDLTAVMALNIGQPKIIKKKAKEEDKHEKQGKRDKLKEQLDRGKEQLQKKMEAAEQKLESRLGPLHTLSLHVLLCRGRKGKAKWKGTRSVCARMCAYVCMCARPGFCDLTPPSLAREAAT